MTRTDYNLPIFEDDDVADLNEYTEEMAEALKVQMDKFGNPLVFKGSLNTLQDLQSLTGMKAGDIYSVISENKNYVYNGTEWVVYSDNMDIHPLPVGGTQGQVLTKKSAEDGDAEWSDQTGGDIVFVGDEEDVPEDTKLFIDEEELANLGSEVVNSLSGNEETKAPSVKAVKDELVNRAEILKSGQINTTDTTAECDFTSGGLYLVIVQGNANSSIIFDVLYVNGYTGQVYSSRIYNSNSFVTITYTTNKVTITNTSNRNYYSVVKLA